MSHSNLNYVPYPETGHVYILLDDGPTPFSGTKIWQVLKSIFVIHASLGTCELVPHRSN